VLPGTELAARFKNLDFDDNRSWAVYQAGVADGTYPKSGGRNRRENFDVKGVTRFVFGVACGATIKQVSNMSGIYCALQDDKGNRLDDVIVKWIESVKPGMLAARNGERNYHTAVCSLMLNSRVEIDQDFPRVKIVVELDDGTTKETTFGPIKECDSTMIGARNVAIISGRVLYRLAVGFHFNTWDADAPVAF
jgi:hypothetical protein